MAPFFSLILPCYNVEAYVERCVRSILAQSFSDAEIILVDDGARDTTPQICDRLAAENACIRVIHKKNGGLSSARNAGLEAACGEYVWFIDSDDWIEPQSLETLRCACQDSWPDVVKFGHFRVAERSKRAEMIVQPGLYVGDEMLNGLRQAAFCWPGKYTLSAWSHVYRRSFLDAHGLRFVSERIVCSEDYLFNLEALKHLQKLQVLADAFYSYELRPGSLTQTYKPDLAERYAELHRRLKESCGEYGALADRFYVWHLTAGTCIPHEYHAKQPVQQARRRVRVLLKSPQIRRAARCSDKSGLSWQKQLQLLALQSGFEPLFYYLHVVKPARLKGRQV